MTISLRSEPHCFSFNMGPARSGYRGAGFLILDPMDPLFANFGRAVLLAI